MSGLFRRLSSRRSHGPDGEQPPAQAEPGAVDAPANAPADPGGHQSLLVDPAATTRVLREDEAPTTVQRPGEGPAAAASGGGADDATRVQRGVDPATGEHAGRGASPESTTNVQGGIDPASGGTAASVHGATAAGPSGGAGDPASTLHPVVRLAPEPGVPYAGPGGERPMFPVSDLPAGVDPDELAAAPPTSARRSRLRKRVGFLRAAREVLMRDLGGFVYELHRTAGDIEHEAHRRLREVKLARLMRLDTELHELEMRLDDVRRHVVVREPGVGGECPHCGELFGSDAHYCSHCGLPLTESARRAVAHEAEPPALAAAPPDPSPPHDQPTEEYSALTEFHWPSRSAEGAEEPTAAVAGPEPAVAGGDERAGGDETPGTADDVPRGDASESGKTTGESAGDDVPGDSTTGDVPGDSATEDVPRGSATGDPPESRASESGGENAPARPATDDDDAPASPPTGNEARGDSGGAEDEQAGPETAASGEDAAGHAGGRADADVARNGRDETVFSPAERRR